MKKRKAAVKRAVTAAKSSMAIHVSYRRKRDEIVVLRNVGVVEIKDGKMWVQDQSDGKVKSFLLDRIIAASMTTASFDDKGFNKYKGK